MITLLDTSALGKLLIEEQESAALRAHLKNVADGGEVLCISSLAVAELRRLAIRLDIGLGEAQSVVERFGVVRLTEAILHQAGTFPQRHLRTLDALHIATAIAVEAGSVITYDARQAAAARDQGLLVAAPRLR